MNRQRDCIKIVAEDEALRSVAVGFFSQSLDITNNIDISRYKRGWPDVFASIPEYVDLLKRYKKMRIIVLIDYDGKPSRYDYFRDNVDVEVRDRFFILGALNNVEKLKECCGATSFENLGALLEGEARIKNLPHSKWQCEELKDFLHEAQRLCDNIKDFFWR